MKRDLPPALRRYILTEGEMSDEELDGMTYDALFETMLDLKGIYDYSSTIKRIIKDVYGINLDREDQIKTIQTQIDQEQQRLYDLQRATEQLRMLERDIEITHCYFQTVKQRAKQITDTVEKDDQKEAAGMTREKLQEVQEDYKRQIKAAWEYPQNIRDWIVAFCLDLADATCYNHRERGQRLWAFSRALDEVEQD